MPASIDEQLTLQWERLQLVPPDEAPPPEAVRQQVFRWQEHRKWAADAIHWADDRIEELSGETDESRRHESLAQVRALRAQALSVLQRLNPEQAWFWTEEWQMGEREVDRDIAAGNTIFFSSDEDFDAALDALDAQRAAAG